MSFLLATLNPGKTRRRRHRRHRSRRNPFFTAPALKTAFAANAGRRRRHGRRRKLSAWQRAVKKYGGVMQAVRAMRGGKHRKKRRSTVSRRRLRSRSRRVHGRRPKMARVRRRRHRRHRMPSRGRGGRFVSRHHRRRRHRRNPVVPTSWSNNPSRRRRHRRRRNPLYLSRRGFSARKHRGYRRLHRRRRHPRYWHNPVLPFFAFNGRRRRHHRRGRTHHRRHHRRYRRNPVLPFFAFNPGGGAGSIMARMKSMVDVSFWTETALPVATGFFGSKLIGNQIWNNLLPNAVTGAVPNVAVPFVRLGLNAAAGAAMAWGAEKFVSKKAGDGIWIGTIVGVASGLLKQLLDAFAPGMSAQIGLSGLGDDISSQMKDAVVRRVQANLGTYMTKNSLNRGIVRPLGTFATRNALSQSTFDPSPRGRMEDYDVANTDTTL